MSLKGRRGPDMETMGRRKMVGLSGAGKRIILDGYYTGQIVVQTKKTLPLVILSTGESIISEHFETIFQGGYINKKWASNKEETQAIYTLSQKGFDAAEKLLLDIED